MQDRHKNKAQYFKEQAYTTQKHVIPFLERVIKITPSTSILEVGCGEGGNMKPFVDIGCRVTGIDINEKKIEKAIRFFKRHPNYDKVQFLHKDFYAIADDQQYDLIYTRDVIEHLPDKVRFFEQCKSLLRPEGRIFIGFPPWQNPFGGHQQTCESRILSKLPYFHLLPPFLYRFILKIFGEKPVRVEGLLNTASTGISIDRLEKVIVKSGYNIDARMYWFINPNYEIKFKLKPRRQSRLIAAIPYLRNFFTTAGYYIVGRKHA